MENIKIQAGEKFLDNVWMLFALGLVIFFVSYIIWGVYQVGQVPEMPAEIKQEILK
jgi:hypothetical protein